MQRLVNRDRRAKPHEIGRRGETCGSRAYDRDLAERMLDYGRSGLGWLCVIADEAFQSANRDQFELGLLASDENALCFTFDGADDCAGCQLRQFGSPGGRLWHRGLQAYCYCSYNAYCMIS